MSEKNIAAALVKAQRAFGPALKDKTNPAFRSKYADLGACIDAVVDALNANGISLLQRTHPDQNGVTVETVLLHESGESWASGTLHVPAAKQDPQGYGSALTYARRYSLMAACGIAPEDDDGNAAVKAKADPLRNATAIKATVGCWDSVPTDEHAYLRELASELVVLTAEQAVDRLATENLDNMQKVCVWDCLPSNVRSGIKKEQEQRAMRIAINKQKEAA